MLSFHFVVSLYHCAQITFFRLSTIISFIWIFMHPEQQQRQWYCIFGWPAVLYYVYERIRLHCRRWIAAQCTSAIAVNIGGAANRATVCIVWCVIYTHTYLTAMTKLHIYGGNWICCLIFAIFVGHFRLFSQFVYESILDGNTWHGPFSGLEIRLSAPPASMWVANSKIKKRKLLHWPHFGPMPCT